MKQWYKIYAYRAHMGPKPYTVCAYVFVKDAFEAYNRFKKMKGVKFKDQSFSKKCVYQKFPDIVPVLEEESRQLEKKILEEGKISLEKARNTWYYADFI